MVPSFPVTTAVVISPFVIIVSRSFIPTTDTMCVDLCRSSADVVECRRNQNVVKSAVQTTLAPGTRPTQSRPSLRRGPCDISYHMIAMFLAARGQCCQTKPKFRFRFLLMFNIRFNDIYPIFREAYDILFFTSAF
uniref:Putative secreted protein n=1 Tax=Ixodes ricinus TaxID=34613 RepID=A0A147BLG0_IXORI